MTRSEAKEILQAVKFLLPTEAYTDRAEEALDMAIEALERKNGNWIPHEIQVPWGDGTTDVTIFRCSVCGYDEQDWQSKFCSNCGADMRGEDDE